MKRSRSARSTADTGALTLRARCSDTKQSHTRVKKVAVRTVAAAPVPAAAAVTSVKDENQGCHGPSARRESCDPLYGELGDGSSTNRLWCPLRQDRAAALQAIQATASATATATTTILLSSTISSAAARQAEEYFRDKYGVELRSQAPAITQPSTPRIAARPTTLETEPENDSCEEDNGESEGVSPVNLSGCRHCPAPRCLCRFLSRLLHDLYDADGGGLARYPPYCWAAEAEEAGAQLNESSDDDGDSNNRSNGNSLNGAAPVRGIVTRAAAAAAAAAKKKTVCRNGSAKSGGGSSVLTRCSKRTTTKTKATATDGVKKTAAKTSRANGRKGAAGRLVQSKTPPPPPSQPLQPLVLPLLRPRRQRQTLVAHRREQCAKSLLPPFISRMIKLMSVGREEEEKRQEETATTPTTTIATIAAKGRRQVVSNGATGLHSGRGGRREGSGDAAAATTAATAGIRGTSKNRQTESKQGRGTVNDKTVNALGSDGGGGGGEGIANSVAPFDIFLDIGSGNGSILIQVAAEAAAQRRWPQYHTGVSSFPSVAASAEGCGKGRNNGRNTPRKKGNGSTSKNDGDADDGHEREAEEEEESGAAFRFVFGDSDIPPPPPPVVAVPAAASKGKKTEANGVSGIGKKSNNKNNNNSNSSSKYLNNKRSVGNLKTDKATPRQTPRQHTQEQQYEADASSTTTTTPSSRIALVVGVELNAHNAALAREAVSLALPVLRALMGAAAVPPVEVVTADITELLPAAAAAELSSQPLSSALSCSSASSSVSPRDSSRSRCRRTTSSKSKKKKSTTTTSTSGSSDDDDEENSVVAGDEEVSPAAAALCAHTEKVLEALRRGGVTGGGYSAVDPLESLLPSAPVAYTEDEHNTSKRGSGKSSKINKTNKKNGTINNDDDDNDSLTLLPGEPFYVALLRKHRIPFEECPLRRRLHQQYLEYTQKKRNATRSSNKTKKNNAKQKSETVEKSNAEQTSLAATNTPCVPRSGKPYAFRLKILLANLLFPNMVNYRLWEAFKLPLPLPLTIADAPSACPYGVCGCAGGHDGGKRLETNKRARTEANCNSKSRSRSKGSSGSNKISSRSNSSSHAANHNRCSPNGHCCCCCLCHRDHQQRQRQRSGRTANIINNKSRAPSLPLSLLSASTGASPSLSSSFSSFFLTTGSRACWMAPLCPHTRARGLRELRAAGGDVRDCLWPPGVMEHTAGPGAFDIYTRIC